MNLLAIKLGFSVAIFAAGAIGGLLPLGKRRAERGSAFMSGGNAFAAGIFLGTGLIHMLGEADHTWHELGWSYPMALLLATVGFMAFLLAEHVLLPHSVHVVAHAHSGDTLPAEEIRRLSAGGTPYALLVALSIHSVIAGVALGGQAQTSGVLYIFLAILAHKTSAAFALGVGLARSELSLKRSRALVYLFALATPLGIVAGAVLGNVLRTAVGRYFDATFMAIAAGSFIYIASMDILQDEFLHAGGRLVKWLLAALAVALTALLSVWI